jgi:flagellar motor switch/type III secretory pathway protein FliN
MTDFTLDTAIPLQLPKVSSAFVQSFNRLFKENKCLNFTLRENDYILQFIPTFKERLSLINFCLQVDTTLIYHVKTEIAFLNAVLVDYPDMGDLRIIPKELRKIALEVAAERLLDLLDYTCHCKSTIITRPLQNFPEDKKYEIYFKILRKKDNSCFYGSVITSSQGMDWMMEQLDRLPVLSCSSMDYIPLWIFFEAGYTTISMDELDRIALNDIILMDSNSSFSEKKIKVRIGSELFFDGKVDSNGSIIVKKKSVLFTEKNMKEKVMTDESEQGGGHSINIQEIPIQLVFQVGESQITFGELNQIQPGYIFEPGLNLDKPVIIRANGKTVGMGELVEIGDRIGIRVLQFNRHNSTAAD